MQVCFINNYPSYHRQQNDQGKLVDLYVPRKCSATNRVLHAKDHASVQINMAQVDEKGVFTGETSAFAIAGFMRTKGDSDAALNRLFSEKKLLSFSQ